MRLSQPSLHPALCVELAGREGGKDRRAGDERAATVALEGDRLDRLILGSAGVDEGPKQAVRAIDLPIYPDKRVFSAIGRALHEAEAAAGARIALTDHQLELARAPRVAEVLWLGPYRKHQVRRRIDEPL